MTTKPPNTINIPDWPGYCFNPVTGEFYSWHKASGWVRLSGHKRGNQLFYKLSNENGSKEFSLNTALRDVKWAMKERTS